MSHTLIVRGPVQLSQDNRLSFQRYGTLEFETADREELAIGGGVVFEIDGKSVRFIVIARGPAPGKGRVTVRFQVDRRNRHQRRAA